MGRLLDNLMELAYIPINKRLNFVSSMDDGEDPLNLEVHLLNNMRQIVEILFKSG